MIVLQHWALPPFAAGLLVVLALHERGLRRLRRHGGDGRPPGAAARQARLARAGLGWAALLWISPLGYWSHELIFARTSLDLGLACLAAPLIVLGAPWRAVAAGARRGTPAPPGEPSQPAPLGAVTVLGLWLAVFIAWNIPGLLDPTVTSAPLRNLEAACYLAAGTLLWMHIVGSHPFSPRLGPLPRVGLILGVLGPCWIDGAAMIFARNVWYRAFAGGPGTPFSRIMDQSMAGGITWVLPLLPLGITAMWCFAAWLDGEEEEWELHWDGGGHRRSATAEELRVTGPEPSQ